jgi:hypothetical protein
MHDMQRISGLRHVQAGERTPRAADRVKRSALAQLDMRHLCQCLPDDLVRLLDRFSGAVLQRQAAKRQRSAALDAGIFHVDQFERAAAEIADDPIGPVKAGHDAERGELRFAFAGDHVDMRAADALRLADEIRTVFGVAAGRRRQHPNLLHAHGVAQRAEPPERGKRGRHRVGGHQAFGLHLAAKTGESLLVEQWRGAARHAFVDDEADRIGADVDDADRRSMVEPSLRGNSTRSFPSCVPTGA